MKAIELKGKKEELEAMYRDISIDATAKWERIRELDEEEQEVMEALSDLKMVECSTEAVVQFILLLIFHFASVLLPSTSGLGLHHDNIYDWTFLVLLISRNYRDYEQGNSQCNGHPEERTA